MSPRKKKLVCPCLHVSEEEVLCAIKERELQTVQDVTKYTEAGGGCTACHPALKQYLSYFCSSRLPSCSDK